MKNKGFTLIELLGVIAILGILGAITFPIISNVINKSYSDIDEKQKLAIERAARNYANENPFGDDLPECEIGDCSKNISVSKLKEKGYLDEADITNPKTGENYNDSCVKVTKSYDESDSNPKFTFEFQEKDCN